MMLLRKKMLFMRRMRCRSTEPAEKEAESGKKRCCGGGKAYGEHKRRLPLDAEVSLYFLVINSDER